MVYCQQLEEHALVADREYSKLVLLRTCVSVHICMHRTYPCPGLDMGMGYGTELSACQKSKPGSLTVKAQSSGYSDRLLLKIALLNPLFKFPERAQASR